MDVSYTLRFVASLLFLLVLVLFGTGLYIVSFYDEVEQRNARNYDCTVVFGAAVRPGGVASDALRDRIETAMDIYDAGYTDCIILSGADSVYGRHEVDVMLDIAYERGVNYEDVVVDYDGKNTQATIAHLNPNRSYAFISNDFHLARISLLARLAGIRDFTTIASSYRHGRYTDETFFLFREIIAFWYYAFTR